MLKLKYNSTTIFIAKVIALIAIFALTGLAKARDKYNTNIKFQPGSIEMFTIDPEKTSIVPGIAKADIDQLNTNPNPQLIKAYMQQLGYEYDIDWKLVYAIGYHESGNYGSSLAQRNHNYFGRKANSSSYASWSTPEEGIRNQFEYLKTRYFDRGLDTPARINPVYAEDNTWHYRVEGVMATL